MEQQIAAQHRGQAEAQLASYRSVLLYADRQRLKAGEFLAVTDRLWKSARFALIGSILWVIFEFAPVVFLDTPPLGLIMPTIALGWACRNYGYAKRTRETIVALQEDSDRSDA